MESKKIPWVRITAEFVVIVAGVSAAFIAEDLREYQNDRAEERRVLGELLADLQTDSAELADELADTRSNEAAVLWALRTPAADLPKDSVISRLLPLFWYETYTQVASAYSGLRDSGRITIIRDPAVRRAVVEYHEVTQPYIRYDFELSMKLYWDFFRQSGAYFRHVPDPVGDTFVPYSRLHMVRSWRELKGDAQFLNTLEGLGLLSSVRAADIVAAMEKNRQLQHALQAALIS